ncbi:ATP-binding domain-containing protein [Bradyrhizobium sp. CCBAU 53380]|uniref:ATP-binding domain-containing protein n=1 Tax=Bradyrhizobium sp. CCBAU 53380 TaxID=1325117 RepID=UPI0023038E4C|nr:ATP-binding domain-containing protein [Bradyrhizobium sp. CCBAU 53380]MDA9426231.1 hypothetical protein [Bradyrhizobium sp. CCBAU 53380]
MSDESVAAALRSPVRLVVIEAPGGCGKTFQACEYASDAAGTIGTGRVLVLAHTHAAVDVFSSRIADRRRVEIRTIDSLIAQIGSAYCHTLGLPSDVAEWARQQGNRGYKQVAERVAHLLSTSPMVSTALARRYPVVICDEHQDASADQHAVVMAVHSAGASLRVFGDPMQHIGKASKAVRDADVKRWDDLKAQADLLDELDYPHRWEKVGTEKLGEWILKARKSLKEGGKIDLRSGVPSEVSVIYADNQAKAHDRYILTSATRRPIDGAARSSPLLVLSAHNDTVRALRPFFNRAIPVWEGHTRDALTALTNAIETCRGDGVAIARATVTFVEEITVGFTRTNYGNMFLDEVANGCRAKRRKKPAVLQELGRLILAEPDHRGVSKMLARLANLVQTDDAFGNIKFDHPREFREAVLLGEFETCSEGMTEISRRRTYAHPMPPQRALSTVHKAKGLETDHVLVMPCDGQHFPDSPAGRCLLYVAISRATHSLTLVVPRSNPSPLVVT